MNALQDVQRDEGFKLPSPQAAEALDAATSLIGWCTDTNNRARARDFAQELVQHLEKCMPRSGTKVTADGREYIWRNYNSFRISKNNFILWNNFLQMSVRKGGPIFFQFVTTHMLKQLIEHKFPAATIAPEPAAESTSVSRPSLTEEEKCVIRYTAGFIPRNLLKKVDQSSQRNKEGLKMCLMDMIEEESIGEAESSEWIAEVNRGGLNLVCSDMFRFVCEMEVVVKKFLTQQEKTKEHES